MDKLIYRFNNQGRQSVFNSKDVLGGKGANLAQMVKLKLPVPPGFTISTKVCDYFYKNNKKIPKKIIKQAKKEIKIIEKITKKKFGDLSNPLLLSVRSGSKISMPGMMDTVLNLGLNDKTVISLKNKTSNGRFAKDSYRRFIQMYSNVVLGIQSHLFEELIDNYKLTKGVIQDTELEESDWDGLIKNFKDIIKREAKINFPQDVNEQLLGAISAVFLSWNSKRAKTYRKINYIPDHWGTAVNIQTMVFGNMGENCATGVAFTRNPSSGKKELFGEFLINAQGEDVVAGIRTPQNLINLKKTMPKIFIQLKKIFSQLEKKYRDMQDIEFTVENNKLWMLLGLIKPTSGTVLINGKNIEDNRTNLLEKMNFISPYIELPKRLTIEENLQVYGRLYGVTNLKNKISIIGNGVVIDPWALLDEIKQIKKLGINISNKNLYIAENATLILPLHRDLDGIREDAKNTDKIGTTRRGIGPAYEDKIGRRAIRIIDLANKKNLSKKIDIILFHHNSIRKGLKKNLINKKKLISDLKKISPKILKYSKPVWKKIDEFKKKKKVIVFEGAQGMLLDVDHGTYPFVTSSNTVAGAAFAGTGCGPDTINYILGIVKAYTTRVGEGPFPTELKNEIGNKIGRRGHEFGTVTNRKRRCGWFDAVLVKQSCVISGTQGIALTKIDVLDELKNLYICVAYNLNGKKINYLPSSLQDQIKVKPIYKKFDGWLKNTKGIKKWKDLPKNAQKYINFIKKYCGVKISSISTSPKREDTILLENPFK